MEIEETNENSNANSNKREREEIIEGTNIEGNVSKKAKKAKKRKQESSKNFTPSRVLFVRNLPVDVIEQEIINAACPFGNVENILILKTKNQAFVQMETEDSAKQLVTYYDTVDANIRGKVIYFQYSGRNEINLPDSQDSQNSILLVTITNVLYPISIDILHSIFSKFGFLKKIAILKNPVYSGFHANIQYSSAEEASIAKQQLHGLNIYNGCNTLRIYFSSFKDLHIKYNNNVTRDFTTALPPGPNSPINSSPGVSSSSNDSLGNPFSLGFMGVPSLVNPFMESVSTNYLPKQVTMPVFDSTVLIVNNLIPEKITPDILFTLFGVYGDVVRVKIMYNKQDTALVQFATSHGCRAAHNFLVGCPLHGKRIGVNYSKVNSISVPKDEKDKAKYTKDYSGSSLHRYRFSGSKNYAHVFPPSNVLHVSNIDGTVSDSQIKELYTPFGIQGMKPLHKPEHSKKMYIIQLPNLENAIDALISTHNYRMGGQNIRVSFSKITSN